MSRKIGTFKQCATKVVKFTFTRILSTFCCCWIARSGRMERLSGTRRIWLKPKQFTHSQTTKKGKITILQKVWHNRLEVMFGFASLASRTQISALYFPTKQATSLHQHSSSISSLPTQRNLCASNPRCLTSKPLNNGSRNQPFSCKHVPQQSVVFPLPLPLLSSPLPTH